MTDPNTPDTPAPAEPGAGRPRRKIPFARKVVVGYLLVVILAFAVSTVMVALHSAPDATFASLIAFVATLPGSLAILLLPDGTGGWGTSAVVAVMVAAALVQAWLLHRFLSARNHKG